LKAWHTVGAILFNIVGPDVAIFGEKDFQQLSLAERMVKDLAMPIEIVRVLWSVMLMV
jgi:pantoate--beta-alanine ligase